MSYTTQYCPSCESLAKELALTKQNLAAAETIARNASLDLISIKKDLFQAEQAIRESQEQEPYGWLDTECNKMFFARHDRQPETEIALYTKQVIIPESAAQLHIKELRAVIEQMLDAQRLSTRYAPEIVEQAEMQLTRIRNAGAAARDVLAKQPDTRALDKALLEAEIAALTHAYDSCKPYGIEFSYMITERIDQLAELNKE